MTSLKTAEKETASTNDEPVVIRLQIELEFVNDGFLGEGKTGEPGEEPLQSEQGQEPITNSTHI